MAKTTTTTTRDRMVMVDCGTITTKTEQGRTIQTEYVYKYALERDNRLTASATATTLQGNKYTGRKVDKALTMEEINKPVSLLEESTDRLAESLEFAMRNAETMLSLELIDMSNAKNIEVVRKANRLTTAQLVDYVKNEYNKILANDLFAVACFYALCSRLVMAKLKGKYKQHADNKHIRDRRFSFIKAYARFKENGLSLVRPYNLESISKAVDFAFSFVSDYMEEFAPDKKERDRLLQAYRVKARLNNLCADYRNALLKEESKGAMLMYNDIELLNEYCVAIMEHVKETGETDIFERSDIVSEYFDSFVDRITGRTSYRLENVSAHTVAMRALDKAIGAYRRIDFAEIKDVERTNSGSEKRGIYERLSADEFALYKRVSRAIVDSRDIASDSKADLLAVLYMRMQGYGYKAIATYLCITQRQVQNGLRNVAIVLSSVPQFADRITLERDSSRHIVPVLAR